MRHTNKQRGFSLFIVLIVMLVIAFMVVAGVQSVNTEMRISSNDADRKMTLSLAETALRAGEKRVGELAANSQFSVNCAAGLCVPAGGVAPKPATLTERFVIQPDQRMGSCNDALCATTAWERATVWDQAGNSREVSVTGTYARRPRYIIEYLNINTAGQYYFRVTARAWGKNANTVVTVQSYVEASY